MKYLTKAETARLFAGKYMTVMNAEESIIVQNFLINACGCNWGRYATGNYPRGVYALHLFPFYPNQTRLAYSNNADRPTGTLTEKDFLEIIIKEED